MIRRSLPLALLVVVIVAAPARAQDSCLQDDLPPVSKPPVGLRFGITPQEAGRIGLSQGEVKPADEAKALAALRELQPPGRQMVLRLNRLFWADGDAGIAEFARRVDAYARDGFVSEVQVRYHPPEGREGDIAGWVQYVRAAVRALAARPSVVALSVTNEANLPISPNTSDGAYEGVEDAIVQGVAAARAEADAAGRPELPIGFTVMWRWEPGSDDRFWTTLGEKATPAFRAALGYVGLQVYPGLVWPPAPIPGRTAGAELLEALTLIRTCFMPKAGLTDATALWVSENGYATNLGRNERTQRADLESTLSDVHAYSGTLNVTDYRYFNLRDNDSTTGADLFDAVGLLRDDYTPKAAFAVFRDHVIAHGAPAPAPAPATRAAVRPRPRLQVRLRRGRLRGRLILPAGVTRKAGCRGSVRAGRRRTRVSRDCRFALRVRARARRVSVRFAGNAALAPAKRTARA